MPELKSIGRVRSLAAFFGMGLSLMTAAGAGGGTVELVSRRDPATGWSVSAGGADPGYLPAISADGRYVAFVSSAENLAPGQDDRNRAAGGGEDVFLFDRTAGTVTLVSRAAASPARTGNGTSRNPTLSADGRFVAFESGATDLVAGLSVTPAPEEGSPQNVFVFDRTSGLVSLVSRAAASGLATAELPCSSSRISADGRYVTFISKSGNLVPGMSTSFWTHVFLHDRVSGQTVQVDHAAGGGQTGQESDSPVLSADGRYVAYRSEAWTLVPGQVNPSFNGYVFLYDRTTDSNVLVSHVPGSPVQGGNAEAGGPALSADGRFVAFASLSSDLVAGASDTNNQSDVFLFDRTTGAVTLVSHAAAAALTAANARSLAPLISADGGTVVYRSSGTDLVAGQIDLNSLDDVFAYDRATGANGLSTRTAASAVTAAGLSFLNPRLGVSADGRYVVFVSAGDDLVPGQVDQNGSFGDDDVFLHDRTTGGTVLVSHLPGSSTTNGSSLSKLPVLAADGGAVAFINDGFDLVADDLEYADAFVYERATAVNRLASRRDPALPSVTPRQGATLASSRTVSDDGRWVLFASQAADLFPGQIETSGNTDLFLYDRITRATILVSHPPGAPTTSAGGFGGSISADGRYVAFLSRATNLVAGQVDGNGNPDVFLWDRTSGATYLVSHATGSFSTAANLGAANEARISADGQFVVFSSPATDLVAGQVDGNNGNDIFLWDRTTGFTRLVSRTPAGPARAGLFGSRLGIPSADGRFVAFLSLATDLVPAQVDSENPITWDAFLYDRLTGATVLASHAATSASTAAGVNGELALPLALSADGRFVALVSRSPELVPGMDPSPSFDNVFLYDRVGGQVRLVSHRAGMPTVAGNDEALEPALSADGRFVAFASSSTDLAAGQVDDFSTPDVFLYDRLTDQTRLISHQPGTPQTSSHVFFGAHAPQVSADGRFVAFASDVPDLLSGQSDTPNSRDVFLFDQRTDAAELVSRSRHSPLQAANQGGSTFSLTGDGSTVVFEAVSSDLVVGDFNSAFDVFLYRRDTAPGRFFTLPPCRLADTRTSGQGPVVSGITEAWPLHTSCGIPSTARAVSLNLTIVAPTDAGFLTLLAGDQPLPATSTINFRAGQVRANNAVIPLAANGDGTLGVFASIGGNGSVHVVLDVNGYFE